MFMTKKKQPEKAEVPKIEQFKVGDNVMIGISDRLATIIKIEETPRQFQHHLIGWGLPFDPVQREYTVELSFPMLKSEEFMKVQAKVFDGQFWRPTK
jgi:hypothetical protein